MAIASIIKYEGDNNTFLYKHPDEDFNSATQLIVHEWQEAIFMMNGEALDLFGPGRYTLEAQNLPRISARLNRLAKDKTDRHTKTPFHSEVYFINKNVHMAIKWGTDSRVRFIDPETGIPLDIGASGEINLQVEDSRKLLVKMVGPLGGFKDQNVIMGDDKTVSGFFRAPLTTEIKTYLASVIKEQNINILEIDSHLRELAAALKERITPLFEEYGLTVPNFYVSYVDLPEDDPNFRTLRQLRSRSYLGRKVEEVEADVAKARQERLAAEERAKAETAKAEQQRRMIEEETKARLKILEAQGKAEAAKTEGLAQAEVAKAQGLAEATVMQAKGYTEKDVLAAEVQKAYAEGIGKMGGASGGGTAPAGTSGGMASDMVNLMMQMKVAGTMMDKMGGMFSGLDGGTKSLGQAETAPLLKTVEVAQPQTEKPTADGIVCPNCGTALPARAKYCFECGTPLNKKCPVCGADVPAGAKFCLECGTRL